MNICMPVLGDEGLDSRLSGHFGSAPCFAIIDTGTRACRVVANANRHHSHGGCHPVAAIAGLGVQGILVGGIGAGALSHLQAAGIRVWRAEGRTAGAALDAFAAGTPVELTPEAACVHHGHGHGHGQEAGSHGGCGGGGYGHGLHGLHDLRGARGGNA